MWRDGVGFSTATGEGEGIIMGREVKRVALDFNWPLRKVWEGFINKRPGPDDCKACGGSGSSPTAKKLHDQWYGNAPFKPEENGSVPQTEEHVAKAQRLYQEALKAEGK
jgi:hypothetical protein